MPTRTTLRPPVRRISLGLARLLPGLAIPWPVVAQAQSATQAESQVAAPAPSGDGSSGLAAFIEDWHRTVAAANADQPAWQVPLVMPTPRLVERLRFDAQLAQVRTGIDADSYGGVQLVSFIPTPTNEISFGVPAYTERNGGGRRNVEGFGDLPAFTLKQRLASAPEAGGDYLVTASLSGGAPTGAARFTADAYTVTPAILAGKGWGRFDVQAQLGVVVPSDHGGTLGTALQTNLMLQYHMTPKLWPEVELNQTHWIGGLRAGKTQDLLTVGVVAGPFEAAPGLGVSVGAGYQTAIAPAYETRPATTPVYAHALVTSIRMGF